MNGFVENQIKLSDTKMGKIEAAPTGNGRNIFDFRLSEKDYLHKNICSGHRTAATSATKGSTWTAWKSTKMFLLGLFMLNPFCSGHHSYV